MNKKTLVNIILDAYRKNSFNIYIDETQNEFDDFARVARIIKLLQIDDNLGDTAVYLHLNRMNGQKETVYLGNTQISSEMVKDIKILLGVLGEIIFEKEIQDIPM